jgi:xanthine/uracil/vitamin C permease (AzgA family)
MLARIFRLEANGATLARDTLAGFTTFFVMS